MKADRYTIDIENPPAQNAGTNYLFPRSTPYDKAERFFAQAALRMVYAVYPGISAAVFHCGAAGTLHLRLLGELPAAG